MTYEKRYRRLEKGEMVCDGDEVDMCRDAWRDPPDWQPAKHSIGDVAPDPDYVAHRQFRRLINN